MGGLPTKRTVYGLAVDSRNPKIMYAAMRDGLFNSVNAGEAWKRVGNDVKNVAAVAINPNNSKEIYLSTSEGTIFKSEDEGMKWKRQ